MPNEALTRGADRNIEVEVETVACWFGLLTRAECDKVMQFCGNKVGGIWRINCNGTDGRAVGQEKGVGKQEHGLHDNWRGGWEPSQVRGTQLGVGSD